MRWLQFYARDYFSLFANECLDSARRTGQTEKIALTRQVWGSLTFAPIIDTGGGGGASLDETQTSCMEWDTWPAWYGILEQNDICQSLYCNESKRVPTGRKSGCGFTCNIVFVIETTVTDTTITLYSLITARKSTLSQPFCQAGQHSGLPPLTLTGVCVCVCVCACMPEFMHCTCKLVINYIPCNNYR